MTEYVEVARGESERGEIVLRRRIEERAADALELRVNGVFVMDTRETGSEIELAAAALDLVEDPRDVVVAGLGLGFTTQRVLADKRVERVMVVEIEEALIGWMRDGTIPHGPALLADKRVHIVDADIVMAVAEATSTYDLVLLDVDNGPGHLVHGDQRTALRARLPGEHEAAAEPRRGPGGVVGEPGAGAAGDHGAGVRQLHRAPLRRTPAGVARSSTCCTSRAAPERTR